jgi:5-formyltetrahydrofolate cyclo-ligase
MTDPPVDRRALRSRLIAERQNLTDAEHRRLSQAITANLQAHLLPFGSRVIAFYWPHRAEYDPMPVVERIVADGGVAALPLIVARGAALEFRQWHPDIEMLVGLYEIPHPAGDVAVIPNVILVPTVGFDQAGYRLGYGGGYYDRTIATLPRRPHTIGIGFEFGRLASIDPQPHDVPMDAIVTEKGVFPR